MYFCGSTVYQRIHVGNAVPDVLSRWLRRWLDASGYETKLVINVTDINDKIYDAAPGASAGSPPRRPGGTSRTSGGSASTRSTTPKATETIDQIVAFIVDLIERGYAYEAEGDVYFRVARFEAYGRLSGQRLDEVDRPGAQPAQGGSARLCALEGEQAGRGHGVGLAVGPRSAGLAHRVLRHGREAPRARIRDPRWWARSRLPPSRERDRAVARARARVRLDLDAQRDAPVRRRGDAQVAGNDVSLASALDRWGRETLLVFFLTAHWRKPLDYSDETLAAARGAWTRLREVFGNRQRAAPARRGTSSRRPSTTTSTRRLPSP